MTAHKISSLINIIHNANERGKFFRKIECKIVVLYTF